MHEIKEKKRRQTNSLLPVPCTRVDTENALTADAGMERGKLRAA